MRLATYNVENLFARARALNLDDNSLAKPILEHFAELNNLFEEAAYTDEIKMRILKRAHTVNLRTSPSARRKSRTARPERLSAGL